MMDILMNNWESILAVIFLVATTVLGKQWKDLKKKIKEVREFIEAIEKALEDDKISKLEMLKITREFKDIF